MSRAERRAMVTRPHPGGLSLSRQCRLLSIGRSSLYYTPKGREGGRALRIGRRRASRLMRLMGLQAIYRAPRTSDPHLEHRVYPDLLKGMSINQSNQVWCADITFYIPVCRGFLYLVAVM